ncbi:MAG TPA: GNAT family acetyltransferase [Chthonomonadaceae bacterium]|nr:GNAT family acetyltransferase [Chthonomonadaceae bacterium]
MTLEIRPFEAEDEPAVAALWLEALAPTAPHHDPATVIRMKLAHDRELFLVAVVEGKIAGTVMGGYDGHRGWIYTVAVSPTHRRRGIGSALLRRVEAELASRGCMKINLQVRTSNAEVMRFYSALGYAVDDVISMGKRLY